jgi:hypothetical protein
MAEKMQNGCTTPHMRSSENSVRAKFAEILSLLKNSSTPLPSTLRGLKNPAIAAFWR